MRKVLCLFVVLFVTPWGSTQAQSEDSIVLERWKDKLAFVHIGEGPIFHYTQDDFDRWAKSYKDLGLTHICFMSPFHCRMSFHPYWDYIIEAMRKFTIALHKHGLKAVEHFSVVNPHHVGDPLWNFHGVPAVLPFLPGLEALVADENGTINGHRVSSFYQIDGSTGQPFFNPMYKNYAICVNNPYYREVLFKHLEDIYALGVDGIMVDDLENYSINTCTCEHCRALFRDKYGYDLPETKDWGTFAGDYKNPKWIDWLKFRGEMNKKFHYDVNAHYGSLGMKDMVRPNYVSGCLLSNVAAYPFDAAAPLWTHTFAEFIMGIKTGHLFYACEGVHRTALAQRNGATAQTLFYPNNENETYFSYANAWCWGQAVFGAGGVKWSSPLIRYEDNHWGSLFAVRKNSDFAVYFSTDTRDFTQNAETLYQRPLVAWMQSAYLSGLNMDMVFQGDPVEVLLKHKVILATHVAMISKEQLEKLRQYVYQGGTLVAVGDFGEFDGNGKKRNAYIAFDLIIQKNSITPKRQNLSYNGQTMTGSYVNVRIAPGSEGTPIIMDNDGNVVAISKTYGKGKFIVMASSIVGDWYQNAINFLYLPDAGDPPMTDAPAYHVDNLRNSAGTFLKEIIGPPVVDIQIDNPDILGFYHTNWDGTVHSVKLLNIAETFVKEKRRISDKEPIVNFGLSGTKLPYEIELSIPAADFTPVKAVLSSPEKPDTEIEIPVRKISGRLHFTVPAAYFSGFALIELFGSGYTTGNGKSLSKSSLLQAWVRDSILYVNGLTPGKTVSVYTTSGAMVYNSIAMSNEANMKLMAPGVYIVQSEGKSIKVVAFD